MGFVFHRSRRNEDLRESESTAAVIEYYSLASGIAAYLGRGGFVAIVSGSTAFR